MQIIKSKEIYITPWVSFMEKSLVMPKSKAVDNYYSLSQADYVNVLAVTPDGRIPLVRQYRPAVEKFTIELPGGLCDKDEIPEKSALRELHEEVGLISTTPPILLGPLSPDTGRLENNMWGFVVNAKECEKKNWRPEPGVERLFVSRKELFELILNGKFDHALHIAIVGLAVFKGAFKW